MVSGMEKSTADKVRENRLRAMAKRQGFRLIKSRARDPRAIGYGQWHIVDASTNTVVHGEIGSGWGLSTDDVERFLTDQPRGDA